VREVAGMRVILQARPEATQAAKVKLGAAFQKSERRAKQKSA